MSRAGRGEPRPPHDLIGAWSDTADPNNRILSRPVSVPSARSRRARKERSETCKTNRHPTPAGRSSAGSTPTPTRTGCTSWTGGAAGSCPAGSPPTRRATAKVSQVRAASILGTSEKYISMLERGQRELKPIRRAYEAWVEAGLPLDWDRQAFEAERKMDSKKHLAK